MLGKAAFFVLGKQQCVVGKYVELTLATGFNDDLVAQRPLDLGCEARSPWFVVSHHAVFDHDAHRRSPWMLAGMASQEGIVAQPRLVVSDCAA